MLKSRQFQRTSHFSPSPKTTFSTKVPTQSAFCQTFSNYPDKWVQGRFHEQPWFNTKSWQSCIISFNSGIIPDNSSKPQLGTRIPNPHFWRFSPKLALFLSKLSLFFYRRQIKKIGFVTVFRLHFNLFKIDLTK